MGPYRRAAVVEPDLPAPPTPEPPDVLVEPVEVGVRQVTAIDRSVAIAGHAAWLILSVVGLVEIVIRWAAH